LGGWVGYRIIVSIGIAIDKIRSRQSAVGSRSNAHKRANNVAGFELSWNWMGQATGLRKPNDAKHALAHL